MRLWPLPHFTLRLQGSGKIEDTQRFMRCLYRYWYHKGYWGTTTATAVDFGNTFFVLLMAVVFTMHFRWDVALHCGEAECGTAALFAGLSRPYVFRRDFAGYSFGLVFVVSTLVACVYEAVRFAEALYVFREVDQLVRDAGIDTGFLTVYHRWCFRWRRWRRQYDAVADDARETVTLQGGNRPLLTTMGWGEFLETVCDSPGCSQSLKCCPHGETLDVLRAVQSLLQTENYLVALYESGVLEHGALRLLRPGTVAYLVEAMFDPFNTLLPRHQCLWAVRARAVRYAVFYLSCYAFFATYSVVKLLVKHAAQIKANYRDFSRRQWNDRALWRFRLYNEVQHLHACRLRTGCEVAQRMVEQLAVSNSLARLMRRTSSTCVLVTLLLSFLNPALLIGGAVAGLSLLWWLTIALFVHATFAEDDPREREYVYTRDLDALVAATHFSQKEWYESGEAFLDNITHLYLRSRVYCILVDLGRTLLLPVALLRMLFDGSIEALIAQMEASSVVVDGVGSVAEGAVFADFGDERVGRVETEFRDGDCMSAMRASSAATPFLPPARGVALRERDEADGMTHITGTARAHAERVRYSVASFSAVYARWMGRQLRGGRAGDAATNLSGESVASSEGGGDGEGGDTAATPATSVHTATTHTLRHFLRELNERVTEQVLLHSGNPVVEPPAEADEVHARPSSPCLPDDVADTVGSKTEVSRGRLDSSLQQSYNTSRAALQSGVATRVTVAPWGARQSMRDLTHTTTAHEREQLFVSQVTSQLRLMRSALSASLLTSYGTGDANRKSVYAAREGSALASR